MKKVDRVLVIGGGIGGLTLALALHRVGLEVEVREKAGSPGEIGAGVGLWSNAIRVFEGLGLGTALEKLAVPIRKLRTMKQSGKTLKAMSLGPEGTQEHPFRFLITHRVELHQMLIDALPAGCLRGGLECTELLESPGGALARFADGSEVTADLIVGADGLRSRVREYTIGPDPLRYGGETCFRGVAEGDHPHLAAITEIQGPGQRAGICPIDAKRVYFWLTLEQAEGELGAPEQQIDYLLKRFAHWPGQLKDPIAKTSPGPILQHDLFDRKPVQTWHKGNVTLLGDAAHPTTPNLGQGACMALEDAACLASLLERGGELGGILLEYERLRVERTTRIVNQSRMFGAMGRTRNPLLRLAFDATLRLMPDKMMRKQIAKQTAHDAWRMG